MGPGETTRDGKNDAKRRCATCLCVVEVYYVDTMRSPLNVAGFARDCAASSRLFAGLFVGAYSLAIPPTLERAMHDRRTQSVYDAERD